MSIPKRLQEIDRALIQLLSERIAYLATSEPPSMQEQLSSYQSLLLQAGLPESVWSSLITNCMAALAHAPSLHPQTHARNVTVVGGSGAMGRFFVERLAASGHHVRILEAGDWGRADVLLGNADLVLLCVPLHATISIIKKVCQYIAPTATLADIASTKTAIVQAMLEHHAGPVVGLHPMFGPGVKSFLAQKVVVCPGRKSHAFQWLLNLIEGEGGDLVHCTPEEHDRMMVVVQAIRHFSSFSLGVFLAEEGISIERSLDFASPLYRTEINMVSRLFSQDGSLYMDIMLASEERGEAIGRLAKTCDRLSQLLAQGDREALINEFQTAREAFREDAPRSLKESNHMINNLSTFLRANEVETGKLSMALDLSHAA